MSKSKAHEVVVPVRKTTTTKTTTNGAVTNNQKEEFSAIVVQPEKSHASEKSTVSSPPLNKSTNSGDTDSGCCGCCFCFTTYTTVREERRHETVVVHNTETTQNGKSTNNKTITTTHQGQAQPQQNASEQYRVKESTGCCPCFTTKTRVIRQTDRRTLVAHREHAQRDATGDDIVVQEQVYEDDSRPADEVYIEERKITSPRTVIVHEQTNKTVSHVNIHSSTTKSDASSRSTAHDNNANRNAMMLGLEKPPPAVIVNDTPSPRPHVLSRYLSSNKHGPDCECNECRRKRRRESNELKPERRSPLFTTRNFEHHKKEIKIAPQQKPLDTKGKPMWMPHSNQVRSELKNTTTK